MYNLPAVMEGQIDDILDALQRADFEERFAELTGGPRPVHQRGGDED